MNRSLPGLKSGLCACLLGSLAALNAWAQTEAPGKTELSAEEKAQKQADKVFTFIKLQALKPAPKRAPAELPASTPALPVAIVAQTRPAPKSQVRSVPAEARAQSALPAEAVVAAVDALAAPAPEAQAAATLLVAADPSPASARPKVEPDPPALQLLSKVEPEIPRQLQADFKGGAVTVQFTVQVDGTVVQAQAVQSSHKRLAAAAVAAVNQWRFAPLPLAREASVDIAFSVE